MLFETRVAHDMPFVLGKIVMTVSGMYSHSSRICCKITVFLGMFVYPLPQYL